MKPDTLIALKASIRYWQNNVTLAKEGSIYRLGPQHCALCERFCYNKPIGDMSDKCTRKTRFMFVEICPVYVRSGSASCIGTPYYDTMTQSVASAQAMLDYLVALQPRKPLLMIANFEYPICLYSQELILEDWKANFFVKTSQVTSFQGRRRHIHTCVDETTYLPTNLGDLSVTREMLVAMFSEKEVAKQEMEAGIGYLDEVAQAF